MLFGVVTKEARDNVTAAGMSVEHPEETNFNPVITPSKF